MNGWLVVSLSPISVGYISDETFPSSSQECIAGSGSIPMKHTKMNQVASNSHYVPILSLYTWKAMGILLRF